MKVSDPPTREKLDHIFEWLAYSNRPLKCFELMNGIAMSFADFETVKRPKTIGTGMLDLCKPVIEVSANGKVTLVHFSARE